MRAASWWISWRELEWPTIDNQDAILRRADEFAASGVNLAIVFGAHFRWDFMPYWTMLHDYMAHVAEALHERNIRIFDHHSAIYIHRYDNVEQMRHIMLNNGSHLPVCPDRKSAESWMFNGQYLNDWRMIDIKTNLPYWKAGYDADVFCPGNNGFVESYCEYVKLLLRSSNIDGLMCDDAGFSKPYGVCGCPECRERFRSKAGIELPEFDDRSFWGNWNNPAWNTFIDDRFETIAAFYRSVRSALPSEDFPLTACCSSSCCHSNASVAHDLRMQLAGCNIAHLELCGNTPTSSGDAMQGKFTDRILDVAFNLGIGTEHNAPGLAIHYGFIPDNANAGWALIKALGGNSWFSNLPFRLGVSRQVLEQMGGDSEPAARAFNFEKEHPELFSGVLVHRCSVYFSYETRNHTAYGSMVYGHSQDFADTFTGLLACGAMPNVVSRIPASGKDELLILPSAALLTDAEKSALENFLNSGGKVIATGPCGWKNVTPQWDVPMQIDSDLSNAETEYRQIFGGKITPVDGERQWSEPLKNFFYHPGKLQDGDLSVNELADKVFAHCREIPGVKSVTGEGFFVTAARLAENRILLFFTAMEYDAQLDHAIESIRRHRTRVNVFSQAPACGQSGSVEIKLAGKSVLSKVILPFDECVPQFDRKGNIKLSRAAVSMIAEIAVEV